MKKLLTAVLAILLIFAAGCEKQETVVKKSVSIKEEVDKLQGEIAEEIIDSSGKIMRAPERTIKVSQEIAVSTSLTFLVDEYKDISGDGKQGRILLATDAKLENDELMLEETNYWCLAVLVDGNEDGVLDGAYNLHYGEMPGELSVEVKNQKVNGKEVAIVMLTIEMDESKEIKEYIFDGETFGEWTIFSRK